MSRILKKLGCVVCCLCLAASVWGCKVETVEQHEKGASSSVSQQESSSRNASSKEGKGSSQVSSGGKEASSQTSQAGESPTENDPNSDPGVSQGEPETPAASNRESKAPGKTPSQSGNTPPAQTSSVSPAPEPEPEPVPETITVTVSVLCDLAVGNPNLNPGVSVPSDGVMVSGLSLNLTPGQTAFDALKQTGLALDYSGSPSRKNVYLRGIGGLYERDCGPASGWVFSVNGGYPNVSCSNVTLNDGDTVAFQFTDGTKLY